MFEIKTTKIFNVLFVVISGFLSITQTLYSQSQQTLSISFVKKADKLIDTTLVHDINDSMSRFNEMISDQMIGLKYVLEVYEDYALFKEKGSLKLGEDLNSVQKLASSYGGTRGIFFTNPMDSLYLNLREFSGAQFKVQIRPKQWKVHPEEQKYIGDYKCIKATTVDTIANPKGVFTSNVVAWFSPELPGHYGPAGYFGLPGLILELQNGKISLEAKEIVFDSAKDSTFEIDKQKGIVVTERQYDSIVEKTAKEFFNISKF